MNDGRRKDIKKVIADIEAMKELLEQLRESVADAKEALEDIRNDEQEYYDNMPESLQGSERGYATEEAINALDTAAKKLGEFEDLPDLDDVISSAEEAMGQ